ncbi:beta-hexosaminidase 2 isoform X2 [Arctopsyche grandis]|uniref:beta-hexosaminidase 2 isoform X2 n=1 Tax=Arctopsyche grandis TaxID=121162 RepID=UPI00406D6F19
MGDSHKLLLVLGILFFIIGNGCSLISEKNGDGRHWLWKCIEGRCIRKLGSAGASVTQSSPESCRLVCGRHGALWPRPTGATTLADRVLTFHPSSLRYDLEYVPSASRDFMEGAIEIFNNNLVKECEGNCTLLSDTILSIHMTVNSDDLSLNWSTDESYSLDLSTKGKNITIQINAETVFGARHGLETLSQLVTSYKATSSVYSVPRIGLIIVSGAKIRDKPIYSHRGLMLDTARNFIPLPAILRTIDAMASTKLNVFHWHITDTQSFPLESPRVPQLVRFGAYSPEQIYHVKDVQHVIREAKQRGIRVLLELDAPAHAGAGWQWGPAAGLGDLAVCWQHQPWRQRCIQPPCGQLNPANPQLYRILADLYRDIAELFPPGEFFHMGGDEVFFPCWNATKQITDLLESRGMGREQADFIRLWAEYQATALRIYDEAAGTPPPIILWSSHLTNPSIIENYLQKDRYIIQTWVPKDDPLPTQLLERGYKIIFSTKDAWYLDHGFWGSTQYHSWRVAYDNILPRFKSVLGGEVCMWTEYVDENNMDSRIWPRAAAVAERLWSDPSSSSKFAQARLARHRERLLRRGVNPEELQPFWCYQNEGECA